MADDPAHPRMHALTLASASHLRNQGHITPEHHARIRRKAKGKMKASKIKHSTTMLGTPFGALAPSPMPDPEM